MKLVLASQGFTTPEITASTVELVGKRPDEINVAIINEAYIAGKPAKDKKWLINELGLISKYFVGTIDFVNLRAYDINEVKKRIEFADIIYIVGGAADILPRLFRETGFDKVLAQLAKDKVIFGTSAGAMLLGRNIEQPEYYRAMYGAVDEHLAQPSLGWVDFNISPHHGRPDHPKRDVEFERPLLQENPFPVYALTDEQAVVYDDGDVRFVGGKPVRLGKGRMNDV
jgi:dipeptidase E